MHVVRWRLVRSFLEQRGFHTTTIRRLDPKTVEEVRIPVPWGHVAGKWWGDRGIEPVVAVHGWQDNANSWDPMAELLPPDVSLLAIDLPGNGISSHLPPFQSYYFSDAVGLLRRVKRYFNLGELHLLGHSGGSAVCFMYAATFPEDVRSYFGIDYVVHCYKDEDKRAATTGGEIDKKIELSMREHSQSRGYTWEEAKQVWIKAVNNSLDEKSCEIMMKRGVTKLPDGKFIFSRDHRLKTADLNVFNPQQVAKLAENIRCHVHLIQGLSSPFMGRSLEHIPNLLEIIKMNAKSLALTELDGKHHLHMDIPEPIVSLLLNLVKKNG